MRLTTHHNKLMMMHMPKSKRYSLAVFFLITLTMIFGAAADTALDDDLKLATIRNETDTIRTLLAQGANPNIEIENGITPLIHFAALGNAVAADYLVRAGARVDEDGNQGCTALTWAARNGWRQMVGLLIDWGADINHQDKGGMTPLMRAAWNGQRAAVEMLLDKNALVTLKDINGNSALTFALGATNDEIASLLLQAPGGDDNGELDVDISEARVSLSPRTPCATVGSSPRP